jgi:shikimate kinase
MSPATKPPPPPAAALGRSVVLVGLMGAGKTSVGKLLAARFGLDFIDADTEIETAAGATIEEIFAHEGEAVFRSGERRVIARLLAGPPRVIATGGGAFMDTDTRAKIRAHGISIWLRANLDTLARRTARRGGRPLLAEGDPREILARLMDERYPVYGEADITVDTGEEGADKAVERIIAALEAHLGIGPLSLPAAQKPGNGNRNGGAGKATARRRPRKRK